jgi:Domain of unknown function (DUF4386)
MTNVTFAQPAHPTTASPGAAPMSLARDGLGSRPDDALRRDEIDGLEAASQPVRHADATAGIGLLAMSALSAFGYLLAVKGLVRAADAAQTARNVAGHEGLFRLGIVSLYLVVALDVVVARALYRVFKPVSEGVSRFAASLRVAYAAVFVVAISQLVGALRSPTQALRRFNTFTNIWDAGLVLFGLNLLVLAYLAYRSGYVPKLLGVLIAIAGCGYVFDTLVRVLVRGSTCDISAITGMGEFVFALWLVIRGHRIALSDARSHDDSIRPAR